MLDSFIPETRLLRDSGYSGCLVVDEETTGLDDAEACRTSMEFLRNGGR